MGLTFLYTVPNVTEEEQLHETWQIRLLDAVAVELDEAILKRLWQEEPLFAKIRSHICECGKPNDHKELEQKYNEIYERSQRDSKEPEQTKT